MIPKKSLFKLNSSTLKVKLSQAGITNRVLTLISSISVYIKKTDDADYFFTAHTNCFTNDSVIFKVADLNQEDYFDLDIRVWRGMTIDDLIEVIKSEGLYQFVESISTENTIKELEEKNKALELQLKGLREMLFTIKQMIA